MDSRERTFLALRFEKGDRIPIDIWMSDGCRHKLGLAAPAAWQAFLDAHDVDLRYIKGPRFVGPARRTFADERSQLWAVSLSQGCCSQRAYLGDCLIVFRDCRANGYHWPLRAQ